MPLCRDRFCDGLATNVTTGVQLQGDSLPDEMRAILAAGGILAVLRAQGGSRRSCVFLDASPGTAARSVALATGITAIEPGIEGPRASSLDTVGRTGDAIVAIGPDLRVIAWNEAATERLS